MFKERFRLFSSEKRPERTEYSPEEIEEFKERAEGLYEKLIKKPEISAALVLLDSLPEDLRYHAKAHTEDVIRETIFFAVADGASDEVIEREAVAAAWHDVGFTVQKQKNEPKAVELLEEYLDTNGIALPGRADIIKEILATAVDVDANGIPSLPHKEGGGRTDWYMLDGDVGNFGWDWEGFFEKFKLVMEENRKDFGNDEEFLREAQFTYDLMDNHDWVTGSARMLRKKNKLENMHRLKAEIDMRAARLQAKAA